MDQTCRRICLTPTRNESWIIQPFLAAARLWASDVVVADQGSTDGTLEQLRNTPGVRTILNDSPAYDECRRQKLLISEARKISGKKILLALDADEALSANVISDPQWERLCEAQPGTVLRFRWVNILPGFQQAWIPPEPMACGFVDDGSEHTGTPMHSRRLPWPAKAPVLDFENLVVLHFQYIVPERVASKHRWYQAWEHLQHPQKSALQIFRQYHHMNGSWDDGEVQPVRAEWIEGFRRAGIDFQSLKCEPITWWDREVAGMLRQHGARRFRKLAIWDKDWTAFGKEPGATDAGLRDPRSQWERTAHRWLAATQKHRLNWGVRGFERLLRNLGW